MDSEFWLNDPTILLKQSEIKKLWPTNDMNSVEKINAITRLIIVFTLVGTLFIKKINILILGIVSLFIVVLYYKFLINKNINENFNNFSTSIINNELTDPIIYQINKNNFEKPTSDNPLSNLQVPEIYLNPNRKSAPPTYNEDVEEKINSIVQANVAKKFDDPDIKNKLFADLGDALEFNRSMTRFTATANQEVPNDRENFIEFCYGEMISGKEGNPLALERQQSGAVNYVNL